MTSLAVAQNTDALRQETVNLARRHKASWIELGRHLYTIHKDKHFKDWGFLSFEAYCLKELGVKQQTAAKLLKSYYFLEREEPRFVESHFSKEETPKKIPNYESVNLLRLARDNKQLTPSDFAEVREAVLEDAKDVKEVRSQVKRILEERNPVDEETEKLNRRNTSIKRLISTINNIKLDLGKDRLLPDYLLKQMSELVGKLQDQLD